MAKVLIIEDEDIIARMYEKTLKFDGFEVELALGGNDGLEKVRQAKPDLVLLDIMMPEPDGVEVLEKIKSNPTTSHIPVVVLTNLSGKNDAKLITEKGAAAFWMKSELDEKNLGSRIKRVMEKSAKQTSN
jgi:CheY-like chemotaxis protein